MKFLSVDTISTGVALQEWCLSAVKRCGSHVLKLGRFRPVSFQGVR